MQLLGERSNYGVAAVSELLGGGRAHSTGACGPSAHFAWGRRRPGPRSPAFCSCTPRTSAHHSYNLYTSFTTRFSASEPVEYYIQKIRILKPRPNKFRPFVGRLVQIRTFFTGTADLVSEHFFPPFGPTSPPIFGGPRQF